LEVRVEGLEVPEEIRSRLTSDDVAARLARKDATLWGPDAESEAAVRLGWLDLPSSSRSLVEQLAQLREELLSEGLDRVVLCGR
jgi:glucose-6-phosphate isomerase